MYIVPIVPTPLWMPPALISRNEVIARVMAVVRREGYDGASLAELSKATGLGKSSLYHHFPDGKNDMVAAVLDHRRRPSRRRFARCASLALLRPAQAHERSA
jgi:AcrR family transcriptional regulator